MAKKNITIDQLAVMVKKGFDKTATTEHVDNKIDGLKKWVEVKFNKIDERFDKIEKIILDDYGTRIEKLESKVEYLENMLNLPSKN